MHCAAIEVKLHLPQVRSLKEKRGVVRPLVEGCRHRFKVAAAEVGQQDRWQAAELGFCTVGPSEGHVGQVLDAVERFIWSFPEFEVISCERSWWGS
jgi:uncharacterized protein